MKRFNDINADNASEYYQAFEAAQEQSVQWLIDYLSINHHIDIESFDYSRDSLIPIWGAIKNNIEFVIEYGNSKPLMGSKYLEKQRSKPLNT